MSNSPVNFLGMMPGSLGSTSMQNQAMNPFGGNIFGSVGAHQHLVQQIQQQQQQQQASAQASAQAELASSNAYNQDPNNLSSTGWGGVVTQTNNMMNPSVMQEATGNAPNNNITAGMAVGDAPIATAGNFNPQTEFAAARMFGNGTQFVKPKKLINL